MIFFIKKKVKFENQFILAYLQICYGFFLKAIDCWITNVSKVKMIYIFLDQEWN